MKLKKVILIFVVLLAVFTCISGCSINSIKRYKTENEYIKKLPSKFNEDESPIICVNDLNLEFIGKSTVNSGFSFDVLSKEPLDENSVKVNIDIQTEYTLLPSETKKIEGKFDKQCCLQYNSFDLKYFNQLKLSDKYDDIVKLKEINTAIDSEYESLIDEMFPSFYHNMFYVQFKTFSENINQDEFFSKVDFIINDKTYTVDIGNVFINNSLPEASKSDYGEYDLLFDSLGRMGVNIEQNENGLITLQDYEMTCKKDIKINKVKLSNNSDSLSIEQASFNFLNDDTIKNQEWKPGEQLSVPAGTKLSANFVIKDTKFINKPNYAVNIYIVIEYEVDGKVYLAQTQALCESKQESQTLYAMYKDKIEMASCFKD